MFKADSGSEFLKFLRTLLVGGVLGAVGVMALLLFGPQWFRGLFLAMQPQSTPSPVAVSTSPASSDAQSGSPLPGASPATQVVQVAFEDIKGSFGEKEITQLAQLGVFNTTTGKFNPTQPITRAEFLRWLVRANNAICFDQPDKMVREAEGGPATFADVPPTHPDFRYIQGVANAGIAVGYDEKSFKPDQPLSRE